MYLGMERPRRSVRDDPVGLPSVRRPRSPACRCGPGVPQSKAAREREPVATVGAGKGYGPDISPRALAVDDGVELSHLSDVALAYELKHEPHIPQESRLSEVLGLVLLVAVEWQVWLVVPVAQRVVGQEFACEGRDRRVVDAP